MWSDEATYDRGFDSEFGIELENKAKTVSLQTETATQFRKKPVHRS